ncbi:MAG: hypothetical protein GDA36_10225 [Rhodobacteraceae bacterium]|nr:hypothetical protein [Paracoccaceae bacterium]
MKCENITKILNNLDKMWSSEFDIWIRLYERKKEINETIEWRNRIAHGEESNTTNVTLHSISNKFRIACKLVDFLEKLCDLT